MGPRGVSDSWLLHARPGPGRQGALSEQTGLGMAAGTLEARAAGVGWAVG